MEYLISYFKSIITHKKPSDKEKYLTLSFLKDLLKR